MKTTLRLWAGCIMALTSLASLNAQTTTGILWKPGTSAMRALRRSGRSPIKTFHAPLRQKASNADIIYAPQGDVKYYSLNCTHDGEYGLYQYTSHKAEICYDADGQTIYFRGLIPAAARDSWVKGTLNNQIITIASGQPVSDLGDMGLYYFNVVKDAKTQPVLVDNFQLEIKGDSIVPIDPTLSVTVDEYQKYSGLSGIDYNHRMCLVASPITVPNGIEAVDYSITYTLAGTKQEYVKGEVATDGSEIYMKGLVPDAPQAWVKGSIANGKIRIASQQTIDADNGYLLQFSLGYNADQEKPMVPNSLSLNYDAASGNITMPDDKICAIETLVNGAVHSYYTQLKMSPYAGDKPARPANPTLVENAMSAPFGAYFSVNIPSVDVDGNPMNTDSLWYEIWLDGEPYEFTSDIYYSLPKNMEQIPYEYTDGWFFKKDGDVRTIEFKENLYESIAVQSTYSINGIVNKSDLITLIGDSGEPDTPINPDEPSDNGLILDPKGSEKLYCMSMCDYGIFGPGIYNSLRSRIRFDADGKTVYLADMNPTFGYKAWLKGSIDEQGIITIPSNQKVFVEGNNEYYFFALDYTENKGDKTDCYQLKVTGDSIVPVNEKIYTSVWLTTGSSLDNGMYSLSWNHRMGLVHKNFAQPEASASPIETVIYYSDDYGPRANKSQIVIDGSTIYMQGLAPNAPKAWVKGQIEGDSICLEKMQLIDGDGYLLAYSLGFVTRRTDDGGTFFGFDDMKLGYDASTHTITTPTGTYGLETFYTLSSITATYSNLKIEPFKGDVAGKPATPIFSMNTLGSDYPKFVLDIPTVDVNGHYLDPSKMTYEIFVDDEIYTFDPSIYTQLKDEMTTLPYNFSDNFDFYISGTFHTIYFYEDLFETIGAQSIYTLNGVSYRSEMAIYDSTSSLNSMTIDSQESIVRTQFFDLLGRKVVTPAQGVLYLKVEQLRDGSMRCIKTIL